MERHLPYEITVLPAIRHRLKRRASTPAKRAGAYAIYLPQKDERLG